MRLTDLGSWAVPSLLLVVCRMKYFHTYRIRQFEAFVLLAWHPIFDQISGIHCSFEICITVPPRGQNLWEDFQCLNTVVFLVLVEYGVEICLVIRCSSKR